MEREHIRKGEEGQKTYTETQRRDTHREETRTEKEMRDTLCTYREGTYMEKWQTRRRDYIVKELHNFKS